MEFESGVKMRIEGGVALLQRLQYYFLSYEVGV